MPRSISLDDVMSHSNIDGEIYLCDISRWLGVDIPMKDAREIRKKLTEIRNKNGKDN